MTPRTIQPHGWWHGRRWLLSVAGALLLAPGVGAAVAQDKAPAPATTSTTPAATDTAKLPMAQVEALVAPIALYPDPLLAQTLVASTYPLEIIQLQQWMAKHPGLKDKALADSVAKQPWDPSVQSMAAVPEVVKRLADDIQWTTDLGNAFLAQQSDVMDAVQRMRKKAKDNNALASSEQQKVETKVIETKQVIVIEPAKPDVIYVPTYSPVYVYGPPVYPYPPIYYPPYTPGAAFVGFTMGVMIGAAWGGAWGHCGWGHNDININVNNNYNRNANINRNTNVNRSGGSSWQHNAQHRGGAPYADRATASKYGGTARGESLSSRQASAGQQQARSGASSSARASGGGASSRSGGGGASAGSYSGSGGGGGDRIGSRDVSGGSSRPSSSSSSRSSGFGSSSGYSGSSARSSSSRGASSYGGGSRGGGGRGGGGGRRR